MRTLLFLVVCIVVCSAQYQFSGNLSSKSIGDNDWTYKNTLCFEQIFPLLYYGGNFLAGEFHGDVVSGSVKLVAGAAYVPINGFPSAYLAEFDGQWNTSNSGQGFATADVTASVGFMATVCLGVEERDPNNTLISTRSMQWILNLGTDKGLSYTLSETSKQGDPIQYVTLCGKSNDESYPEFSVCTTYMAVSHAGIIEGEGVKDVPVVPGSIESIINIKNFPYANQNNKVSLLMAVATGEAQASVSGQTVYDSAKKVYFSLNKKAYVGDKEVDVNISTFVPGNFDEVGNSNFQQQVTQKYGAKGVVKLVKVSFPAGAANIVYDPSIGSGASVQESNTGGASFAAPVLAFVLCVVAFVLF